MVEIKSKLRELLNDKKSLCIIIVGVVALFFLGSSELSGEKTYDSEISDGTVISATEYAELKEKELEKILESIEGAGACNVMLTVDNCYENVYAKGVTTKADDNSGNIATQTQEEYIIVKNGSNTEDCLLIKVYEPKVRGVAVVAEGADDIGVKKAITETVCALFDISTAKVSVTKKYEE